MPVYITPAPLDTKQATGGGSGDTDGLRALTTKLGWLLLTGSPGCLVYEG